MRSRCYAIFRIHKHSIHFCIISLLNSRRTTDQGVGGGGGGGEKKRSSLHFFENRSKVPGFCTKKSTLILEIFACWTLILYVVHGPFIEVPLFQ